jgi:predicted DNA-binding transcriptional regulator
MESQIAAFICLYLKSLGNENVREIQVQAEISNLIHDLAVELVMKKGFFRYLLEIFLL